MLWKAEHRDDLTNVHIIQFDKKSTPEFSLFYSSFINFVPLYIFLPTNGKLNSELSFTWKLICCIPCCSDFFPNYQHGTIRIQLFQTARFWWITILGRMEANLEIHHKLISSLVIRILLPVIKSCRYNKTNSSLRSKLRCYQLDNNSFYNKLSFLHYVTMEKYPLQNRFQRSVSIIRNFGRKFSIYQRLIQQVMHTI